MEFLPGSETKQAKNQFLHAPNIWDKNLQRVNWLFQAAILIFKGTAMHYISKESKEVTMNDRFLYKLWYGGKMALLTVMLDGKTFKFSMVRNFDKLIKFNVLIVMNEM